MTFLSKFKLELTKHKSMEFVRHKIITICYNPQRNNEQIKFRITKASQKEKSLIHQNVRIFS